MTHPTPPLPPAPHPLVRRAVMAFLEGYSEAVNYGHDQPLHLAISEVLQHCGGELMAMDAERPDIKAHQAARVFFDAGQAMQKEAGL
jgi:hypothetical protein